MPAESVWSLSLHLVFLSDLLAVCLVYLISLFDLSAGFFGLSGLSTNLFICRFPDLSIWSDLSSMSSVWSVWPDVPDLFVWCFYLILSAVCLVFFALCLVYLPAVWSVCLCGLSAGLFIWYIWYDLSGFCIWSGCWSIYLVCLSGLFVWSICWSVYVVYLVRMSGLLILSGLSTNLVGLLISLWGCLSDLICLVCRHWYNKHLKQRARCSL